MKSHTSERFREAYARLPAAVQRRAREAYNLFKQNPYHPSLRFKQVHPTRPIYSVRISGDYRTDIVVNDVVIVELKAVRELAEEHKAQLLNYLKATTIEVGLLLNFGVKAEHKRKVYDNDRKGTIGIPLLQ